MVHEPVSDETAKLLRAAWFRYLDTVGETRPALYRYCRRMTGNIWDAEDLLQDTLLRGFGAIGRGDVSSKAAQVRGPRAYLFRIATNLWIDQMRRRQLITSSLSGSDDSSPGERSIQALEAASLLMSQVAPQERAAVVLQGCSTLLSNKSQKSSPRPWGRLNPHCTAGVRGSRRSRACGPCSEQLPRSSSTASLSP